MKARHVQRFTHVPRWFANLSGNASLHPSLATMQTQRRSRASLAIIALALVGCASAPTGPAPIVVDTKTVSVSVPIAVACIAAADIPAMPKPMAVPATDDPYQRAVALAAYVKAMEQYIALADALLKQCAVGGSP